MASPYVDDDAAESDERGNDHDASDRPSVSCCRGNVGQRGIIELFIIDIIVGNGVSPHQTEKLEHDIAVRAGAFVFSGKEVCGAERNDIADLARIELPNDSGYAEKRNGAIDDFALCGSGLRGVIGLQEREGGFRSMDTGNYLQAHPSGMEQGRFAVFASGTRS